MRPGAISIILLFCCYCKVHAQPRNNLGLYFNVYDASQAFSENIPRNPIGIAFSFLRRSKGLFLFGGELGIGLHSGKKYFYETIDEGVPENIERLYEENGFFSYKAILRYLLVKDEAITPYLEAKAGASTFFSAIRAMQVSTVFKDDFLIHDTVLSGGFGGGLAIDLGENSWRRKLLLDLSATYIWGSDATYRNSEKDVFIDSFSEGFKRSDTDALQYKVGLVIVY